MTYIIGKAADEYEAYRRMLNTLNGGSTAGTFTYSGTGDGELQGLHYRHGNAMAETYTLTCVVAAAQGGEFSVVGSVSGVMPNAVVGEAYQSNGVSFAIDFGDIDFALTDQFVIGGTAVTQMSTRTDNWYQSFITARNAPAETWTFTCIVAGIHDSGGGHTPAQFSVVGSISGNVGTITEGLPFGELLAEDQIANGYDLLGIIPLCATANLTVAAEQFAIGDSWNFTTTIGAMNVAGDSWELQPGWTWVERDYHTHTRLQWQLDRVPFKGFGLADADEFFIGFDRRHSYDSYNIWDFTGFRSYDPLMSYPEQIGWIATTRPTQAFWTGEVPFWHIFNGRRSIFNSRSSQNYAQSYMGFYLPYEAPQHIPYPLVIGGDSRGYSWDSTSWRASCFWNSKGSLVTNADTAGEATYQSMMVYTNDGGMACFTGDADDTETPTGQGAKYNHVFLIIPYNHLWMTAVSTCVDGSYLPMPVSLESNLYNNTKQVVFGELDGVFAISGKGEQAPENILYNTTTKRRFLIMSNRHRLGDRDYVAMELS